jgi:hypothetical protein
MSRVGIEPTIPVFERAKMVHCDRPQELSTGPNSELDKLSSYNLSPMSRSS